MRVLCVFMDLYARYHRLLYFDAFTGCLSEFAEFRSISMVLEQNCAKLEQSWKLSFRRQSERSEEAERALG